VFEQCRRGQNSVMRSELANAHLFIKVSTPVRSQIRKEIVAHNHTVASALNLAAWMEFKRGQFELGSAFVDHNAIRDCKGAGFYERRKKKHKFALDFFSCVAEMQHISSCYAPSFVDASIKAEEHLS
jgi:hypothetical protein